MLSSQLMKQSVAKFVRALTVLLLFVPAPMGVVNQAPAMAAPAETLAAEPAVILPEEAEEEEQDPWTARFLAPAVVVLSVVAVGASASYYVVRIRGRYRVAE
jgi:hypothetical protein